MQYEFTNACSRYGASMGRPSASYRSLERDGITPGKLYLRRVRLNAGGYDPGGAYWGTGTPLWVAYDGDETAVFVRGVDRDAAKDAVRIALRNDDLRFYR